jgi:hypothetical protein
MPGPVTLSTLLALFRQPAMPVLPVLPEPVLFIRPLSSLIIRLRFASVMPSISLSYNHTTLYYFTRGRLVILYQANIHGENKGFTDKLINKAKDLVSTAMPNQIFPLLPHPVRPP